jgi:hypothetical protein
VFIGFWNRVDAIVIFWQNMCCDHHIIDRIYVAIICFWQISMVLSSFTTNPLLECLETWQFSVSLYLSSRYVFSCVICFRGIHFILISTAHALFLTCLPVSIYGT